MEYRKLGKTDLNVSRISYGASPLGSVFRDISESDGIRTVHEAIDSGINLIDVSPYYGLTKAETVLGKALKSIPRDKYYLSTKAGRYGADFPDFDFSAKRITQSLEESLGRLGVDGVDILFLHDIEFGNMRQILDEALPCLQELKQQGKVKYIGVTGYPLKVFTDTISQADIDCILTYCRYALYDNSLAAITPALVEKGVGIINASATGMGLLTQRGAPGWHPGKPELLEACKKAVSLCDSRGVDITQVALQYAIDHEDIASTLVGTANPINMQKNIKWAAERIDGELVGEIRALFEGISVTWPSGYPENQD